ncbi:hypothetical protein BJP27_12375 [Pseudomonas oryzihabitans]|nr:hypothetical protein BJP27_12375 [Pseudomonas psychrotolerans]
MNSYRYAPNPTGWVDPLGLANVKGQCPGLNSGKRKDKYYNSRREAFKNAKRDAQIPTSDQPIEAKRVPLEIHGKQLINENGVVQTREYHYLNLQNQRVVIQEHSYGHPEFSSNDASSKPHFNVREYDPVTRNAKRTTTLNLQSVASHYVFDRKQEIPKHY